MSTNTGFYYNEAFGSRYLPKAKWWRENTDSGIKLNFGLQDGDPDKGYDIVLDSSLPNALCVGIPGSGKSPLINQMMASLITRYSPTALSLVMVDFKDAEFCVFADRASHLCRIPHASFIAGTKDGSISIPLLNGLMDEMSKRLALFTAEGVQSIELYNKRMRKIKAPQKCLPRILVVLDEYQVMFEDASISDIVFQKLQNLLAVSASCGCHLFLSSQSWKGSLPADIMKQFALRVALRCSEDISISVLGSPVAALLKPKFGYVYTNTEAGASQASTRVWCTPFIPDEELFDTEKRKEVIPDGSLCILDAVQRMAAEQSMVDRKAPFIGRLES